MLDHRTKVGAERRLRTRRKLLVSAFQLRAERDVDESIIELVIKQAGLSRGTFYNHFRSERELLMSVASEVSNDIIAVVEPEVIQYQDPAVRVACGISLSIQLACRYPLMAAFLSRGGAAAVLAGGTAVRAIARDVQSGLEAGQFSVQDSSLAIDLVLGPVLSTIGTSLQRPIDSLYISNLIAAILRSLGANEQAIHSIARMNFGEPKLFRDALFAAV